MKYKYFCQAHADRMHTSEGVAVRAWTDTIRRGMKAYVECRSDTAYIYLYSAMEIGLLRYKCEKNDFFNSTHLAKPLEFLIELLLVEANFNEAVVLLSKISVAINEASRTSSTEFDEVFEKHYQRIEICEKQHLVDFKYNAKECLPNSAEYTNTAYVH